MFWKVGRGTGRPQISAHAHNDADDAHWKASKVAPAMLATEAAVGGTKQDGAHVRTHAHNAGQGGNGGRARAHAPPPSPRPPLPPAQ